MITKKDKNYIYKVALSCIRDIAHFKEEYLVMKERLNDIKGCDITDYLYNIEDLLDIDTINEAIEERLECKMTFSELLEERMRNYEFKHCMKMFVFFLKGIGKEMYLEHYARHFDEGLEHLKLYHAQDWLYKALHEYNFENDHAYKEALLKWGLLLSDNGYLSSVYRMTKEDEEEYERLKKSQDLI